MSDRPVLALLPGLLCDAALWRPQIEGLADFAEPRVADLTRDDSIAAMARRCLADLPERFALAGLSMGGYVALEMFRTAPERVTRLALLNTRATADTAEDRQRRGDLLALADRGQFKGVTRQLLPRLIHQDRLQDEALTSVIYAMAETVGRAGFIRQQRAIMRRDDMRPLLPTIRVPTLVAVGRQDALTPPAMAMELAAGIPDARLDVLEHCGHLTTLERPDETTAALRRWLGS
ncbi:alpha/beta fold hydrolase [Algihabitans albus]|uniref:alpha/beta fold hydrolase n=1 Tax=Algihabitans albus TaxID=2164067 RepID=UPI000E5CD88F|nr:alpha/beta fold hydrolase [Algihabitans albus]